MKTIAILKTKDQKRAYKFELMEEPILSFGIAYYYTESIIYDDIVVYQRLIDNDEIYSEINSALEDVYKYDREYCDFHEG